MPTVSFSFYFDCTYKGDHNYDLFPERIGHGRIFLSEDIVSSDVLPKALRRGHISVDLRSNGASGAKNETAIKKIRRLLAEAEKNGWEIEIGPKAGYAKCVNEYTDLPTFLNALDIYEGEES